MGVYIPIQIKSCRRIKLDKLREVLQYHRVLGIYGQVLFEHDLRFIIEWIDPDAAPVFLICCLDILNLEIVPADIQLFGVYIYNPTCF